jgi:superfamily II DNA helicase RecQ
MSRRRRRPPIPVTLTLPAEAPTPEEIDAILMATDAIIGRAGRNGVSLILKGSRSQKVREWEWDQLPDYGALRYLTLKEIGPKVDWCIHHGWLRLEHNRDGIPLLLHSAKGWERVKRLWVERLLAWFTDWQRAGQPERVWPRLETIHRDIKLMLLETISDRKRDDLSPILRSWFRYEVRQIRQAINRTLHSLGQPTLRNQ